MPQLVKWLFSLWFFGGSVLGPLAVFVPEHIQISGKEVYVRDVFQDLPDAFNTQVGEAVLFPAPAVGSTLHLSARQLVTLARKHKLPWPSQNGGLTPTTLVRKMKVVTENDLKHHIRKNLPEFSQESMLTLHTKQILLPDDIELTALVFSNAFVDKVSGQFFVQVEYEDLGKTQSQKLRGILSRIIKVPVLREPLVPGVVIEMNHLEWIDYPQNKLNPTHLLGEDAMIGYTPSHPLQGGVPLRGHDLKKPLLIKKGEMVTVSYTGDRIKLTLKAKALENGVLGETINLQGHDHKKIVSAVVTGRNIAEANPL